jgi:hypothetical protein
VFERYTEKARRTIFFARYEASQYGSPYIETEHLLLGLLRENRDLERLLPPGSIESIRKQVDSQTLRRESVSTSVDLPLSNECKRVLAYAAEEAERLAHKHIGTEHLFLGLLREKKSFAADILAGRGIAIDKMREHFAKTPETGTIRSLSRANEPAIEIHGTARVADSIRERVQTLRTFKWHWQKRPWKPMDLVVRENGDISFDLSLESESKDFKVVKGGWRKDRCFICHWELIDEENQPAHGTGYTNGRDWVCTECYEKFVSGPDFFASTHSDIT